MYACWGLCDVVTFTTGCVATVDRDAEGLDALYNGTFSDDDDDDFGFGDDDDDDDDGFDLFEDPTAQGLASVLLALQHCPCLQVVNLPCK